MALILTLAACGGGGGGAPTTPNPGQPGGSTPPDIPVAQYAGNVNSATLSKDNAVESSAAVVGALTLVGLADAAWVDVAGRTGDVSGMQAGPSGGTVTLTGSLTNGSGTLTLDYVNFGAGEATFDGRVVQRSASARPGNRYRTSGPGDIGFDNLVVTTPEGTVTLQGSVSISGEDGRFVDLDLVLRDDDTGEIGYYEDVSIRYDDTQILGTTLFSVVVEGRIYDGERGFFDVTTVEPFVNPQLLEAAGVQVAQRGEYLLQAEGNAVTVAALSLAYAAVGIDTNGDATSDEFRRLGWRELAGSDVIEQSVVAGPVANAGPVFADFPQPATVDGRFSHDDDGDWLTLTWRLLAKPLESAYDPGVFAAGSVTFTPDVEGDYLFELTASDGQSATRMGVTVEAQPVTFTAEPRRNSVGGLELAPGLVAGVPTLIDGRAASQDAYGNFPPDWFVAGEGAEVVTEQADPFIAEYVTDTPGRKTVQFDARRTLLGHLSASASLPLFVGRNAPTLRYELVGNAPGRSILVDDYNADGIEDLVVRELAPAVDNLVVLLADGNGSYTRLDAGSGPSEGSGDIWDGQIATGDLNSDGRLDIAIAGAEAIQIAYQGASGLLDSFIEVPLPDDACIFPSNDPGGIGVGDIDGDGRDDLAALVACDRSIALWRQQPDGSLGSVRRDFVERAGLVSFGDANDDGRMDALIGSFGGGGGGNAGEAVVALGDATGTFVVSDRIALNDIGAPNLTVADVNGDGRSDIVLRSSNVLIVLARQPDGALTETLRAIDPVGFSSSSGQVHVTDLDNDGLTDFLMCGSTNTLALFQTPGPGLEYTTLEKCSAPSGELASIALYDYDADGARDIIIAGGDGRRFPSTKSSLLTVLLTNLKPYATPR
ncbi:MAG: FG-GAP-like repeat-containing protein [Gammaproteobacteria bacterium]